MARSGGQWQQQRYSAACVLACALLGLAPCALAADGDTVASVSSLPGGFTAPGAPGNLEVPAMPAAPQPPQDLTQSTSGPGEGPDNTAKPGAEGILALHSDIKFSFMAPPRKTGDQSASAIAFAEQVKRIAAGLQIAAHGLYPDAIKRIGAFDVYVGDSSELAALSSGSGRIVVNAGFARLNPTDDWLAFVIAREMGHIVAGHHDSNSGASLLVSVVMNIIVPGSGLIKSALSFAGSQMASETGRDKQVKEADEVAMKLLEAAGYTAKSVVLNLRLTPLSEETDKGSWATTFRVSARRLTEAGQGPYKAQAPLLALEPANAAPAGVGAARTSAPQLATPPAPALSTAVTARTGRWEPEDTVQTRPSGLPGPLMSGAFPMPVRTDR
jgi:hypothetical protein